MSCAIVNCTKGVGIYPLGKDKVGEIFSSYQNHHLLISSASTTFTEEHEAIKQFNTEGSTTTLISTISISTISQRATQDERRQDDETSNSHTVKISRLLRTTATAEIMGCGPSRPTYPTNYHNGTYLARPAYYAGMFPLSLLLPSLAVILPCLWRSFVFSSSKNIK